MSARTGEQEAVGYVGTRENYLNKRVLRLLRCIPRRGGFLQDVIPAFTLTVDVVVKR